MPGSRSDQRAGKTPFKSSGSRSDKETNRQRPFLWKLEKDGMVSLPLRRSHGSCAWPPFPPDRQAGPMTFENGIINDNRTQSAINPDDTHGRHEKNEQSKHPGR
jgi:hypothetical protein